MRAEGGPSAAPPESSTSRRAWVAGGVLIAGCVAIDALSGVARSPLVPPLPPGVRVPRWTARLAVMAGLDRVGSVALVVVSIGVVAAMVAAFGVLAWEAWRRRVGRGVAVAAVVVSLGLSVAAPVLLSRDVYSYAAYGRILSAHHTNPYREPPSAFPGDPFTRVVSREWIDTRSVYGPGFTLLSAAITRWWAGSPAATVAAFKAVSALGVLGAALCAGLAARRRRPEREALAVVVVGLNPVVVLHTVGGGHNDALVAGMLAGAYLLTLARRSPSVDSGGGEAIGVRTWQRRTAGWPAPAVTALITLAVSVKVVALIPLAWWLWTVGRSARPGRGLRVAGLHAAVAATITAALAAPLFAGWRTVSAVANLASRQGWASGARLVARGAQALGRGVGTHDTATAFGAVVYAAFLALFVVVVLHQMRRAPAGDQADAWGSSLVMFALAAPYLLPWYAAWFLPFLALMSNRRLAAAGLAASGLLALTGIPAEPLTDPSVWRAMMLGVHYAVAPLMLGLLAVAITSMRREDPDRLVRSGTSF